MMKKRMMILMLALVAMLPMQAQSLDGRRVGTEGSRRRGV